MFGSSSRGFAVLAVVASLLGLLFASYSTSDYASHLDRRLHDVHCSFIPGAAPTSEAEACRAAMYSPYSALFKESLWGGIPISLFALGAFTFFAGFALYLWVAGSRAPKLSVVFFAALSFTPLLVSLLMLAISVSQLGHLCKTCVGIYMSSALLAIAGFWGLRSVQSSSAPGMERPALSPIWPLLWLFVLGVATLTPALVYAASAPDQRPFLNRCGQLKLSTPKMGELVSMRGARAVQAALVFEDPLCPTCKAFHDRLVAEGLFDRLDLRLALFPLDSECNWMLKDALHPGACLVSKAILCSGEQARTVLEWAYENQEQLTQAGKASASALRARIRQRFGDALDRCIGDRKTEARLNAHLHFASDNAIPVSTPQLYLGEQRVCDEDTDIGLRFTLRELAPALVK